MDKDEQLTRQEVSALVSASEKVAGQLTLIAERMTANSEALQRIIAELSNGLPKKIADPVVLHVEKSHVKLDNILADQREVKWLIRAVSVVVGFVGLEKLAVALFNIVKP